MGNLTAVLNRIASATSVLRTRSEDATRAENNGGHKDELYERIAASVSDLEKVAKKLETLVGA